MRQIFRNAECIEGRVQVFSSKSVQRFSRFFGQVQDSKFRKHRP